MKKALPILVIASFMLSMIPSVYFASALPAPTLKDKDGVVITTGTKGLEVHVTGPAGVVPAGITLQLYWDTTTGAWDGTKGLMNSTTAKASGAYEVWFDVPEATNGAHYVWVKDADGNTASAALTVLPKVKNTPTTGLPGDTIAGVFNGFAKAKTLALVLSSAVAPTETQVLLEVLGTPDGVKKEWTGTLAHEYIVPGSMLFGVNTVLQATDDGKGKIIDAAGPMTASGTINYVTGEYTIEFEDAPPVAPIGLRTDYKYWALGGTEYELGTATTNSLGTATKSWKVSAALANGVYHLWALDNGGVTFTTPTFNVGPVITLSSDVGTVGSHITINGRGFTVGANIVQGDVTIAGEDCYITTDLPVTVDSTGRIRLQVVIPQVADEDEYTIDLTSAAGNSEADYEVTALAATKVTPAYGPQASTVTVSGKNFPKIAGIEILVTMGATEMGTAKTLSDGTFSKAFKVPAIADGKYTLNALARDEDTEDPYNVADGTSFKVGTMNIILSDDEGPTGTTIGITGNGFTPNETWNATIGDEELEDSGAISAAGLISSNFMIPQLAVGTYTVTVWDIDAEIALTTNFKVTKTTTVTLSVPSAPNEFNVTLRGLGFADSDGPVDFVLYNKTSTGAMDFWWTLDVVDLPGGEALDDPCVTNSTGEFYGYWLVPDDDILSKGNYYLNVTDVEDYAVTGIPFAVGDVHVLATPRKTSFRVGDTISFNLEHSFGNVDPIKGSILKIYNPTGALIFSGDELNTWTKTGLWYTAPYSSQNAGGNPMVLSEDAPLGTWSWKWIDADDDTAKTGTFEVVASAESVLETQVTALTTAVGELKTSVAGLKTDVAASIAGVATTASAAQTSAAGAKTAADAATAAATAAGTKADAATAAANSAAAAAKSAADAASGLTTLVYAAIGASLIAALAAIVALMQISRKIA